MAENHLSAQTRNYGKFYPCEIQTANEIDTQADIIYGLNHKTT